MIRCALSVWFLRRNLAGFTFFSDKIQYRLSASLEMFLMCAILSYLSLLLARCGQQIVRHKLNTPLSRSLCVTAIPAVLVALDS